MNRPILEELGKTANSNNMADMWLVAIERETKRDFQIARKLYDVVKDLQESMGTRQAIIDDLNGNKSLRVVRSATFFRELQEKGVGLEDEIAN